MHDMPEPGENHRRLNQLAGRWSGQEKMHPSPWDPKGGMATARCDNKVAVDGFLITHEYEQERNGVVNFRGHGVFTYDANEKCYVMHWWDSMGMGANIFKGNFNGNTLQMTCPHCDFSTRATWEFPEANRYRFRMECSQDGKQWNTMVEGDYTKAK